jgi:hypothetical protein
MSAQQRIDPLAQGRTDAAHFIEPRCPRLARRLVQGLLKNALLVHKGHSRWLLLIESSF